MTSQPITVLMVNEYPDYIDAKTWAADLKKRVPQLEFRLWPDAGNKGDIDIVLIDKGASSGFFDAMTGVPSSIWEQVLTALTSETFPKVFRSLDSQRASRLRRWCSILSFAFSAINGTLRST